VTHVARLLRPSVEQCYRVAMNATESPIDRAATAAGSSAALAKLLTVNPTLVHQWRHGRRPVAGHHCPAIEAATGVRCEELRPDLQWLRNEAGDVTGYQVPIRAA
jgi:DNA-binding transcriptional regulator YdaS (Cro superfamily)